MKSRKGLFKPALLSLGLHAVAFAAAALVVRQFPLPKPPKPKPMRIEWQGTLPGSGSAADPARARQAARPVRSASRSADASGDSRARKLFKLSPFGEDASATKGRGELGSDVISTGRVVEGSWDGQPGTGGVSILVEGRDLPVLNRVADRLQEILEFSPDLARLHPQGLAVVSFMADTRGGLHSASLRSPRGERFLKVHLLTTLLSGLLVADATAELSPVKITARFSSGINVVPEAAQLPRIVNREIEILRHRPTLRIPLGPAFLDSTTDQEFGADVEGGARSWALGTTFELESLFDSDHRREFGWQGDKKTRQESRLFLKRYKALEAAFKARGYLS
jgi:hypothetical protein